MSPWSWIWFIATKAHNGNPAFPLEERGRSDGSTGNALTGGSGNRKLEEKARKVTRRSWAKPLEVANLGKRKGRTIGAFRMRTRARESRSAM